MPSTYDRVTYRMPVALVDETFDLVPPIGADQRLVLADVRCAIVAADPCLLYIFRIPNGGVESNDTALAFAVLRIQGQEPFSLGKIVLGAGEGLAVGITAAPATSPAVVFDANGELETITP